MRHGLGMGLRHGLEGGLGLRHGLEAGAGGMGLRHGLEDGLGLRHGLEAWGREGWPGLKNGKKKVVDKTWKQISNKSQKNLSFPSGARK